jgi:hypothetical protein
MLGVLLVALAVPAFPAGAISPGTGPFQRTWQRTDSPVASSAVVRTWMWGPSGFSANMWEPYAETPGQLRLVQYYDKSRMEITNPNGDQNSIWYVTNGLLVTELITGRMQLGDSEFDETRQPARVNVAGDPDDPNGPTYRTFGGKLNEPPLNDGATITQRIARDGTVSNDGSLSQYGVTAAQRLTVPGIDHQIASPFWAFMNATGTVWENGQLVTAPLFENPYYATGYPLTEAYWATVQVGGQPRDVLMQCFERRCLTYTPQNPVEWQVEMGNVGQHYYRWRYNASIPTEPPPIASTEYLKIGPAPLAAWPYEDAGEESFVRIENQSPHTMTITFEGEQNRTMSIGPCVGCIVYPPGTELQQCADDLPGNDILLRPGNYRVTIDYPGQDVISGQGHWTLVPEAGYASCFYVVEQPASSPAPDGDGQVQSQSAPLN